MWWDHTTRTKFSFLSENSQSDSGALYIRSADALFTGYYQCYYEESVQEFRLVIEAEGWGSAHYTMQWDGKRLALQSHHRGTSLSLMSLAPLVKACTDYLQYPAWV